MLLLVAHPGSQQRACTILNAPFRCLICGCLTSNSLRMTWEIQCRCMLKKDELRDELSHACLAGRAALFRVNLMLQALHINGCRQKLGVVSTRQQFPSIGHLHATGIGIGGAGYKCNVGKRPVTLVTIKTFVYRQLG